MWLANTILRLIGRLIINMDNFFEHLFRLSVDNLKDFFKNWSNDVTFFFELSGPLKSRKMGIYSVSVHQCFYALFTIYVSLYSMLLCTKLASAPEYICPISCEGNNISKNSFWIPSDFNKKSREQLLTLGSLPFVPPV